mmetsp:Transcript_13933/g.44676  ORF Transcript_13933/g.44676 Transcript_13933/m.44676 type:complete len:465 (+) Transcript_13933:1-1395(+)
MALRRAVLLLRRPATRFPHMRAHSTAAGAVKSEEARRIEEEAIKSVTPEKRKQLEALLVKNAEYKPEKIAPLWSFLGSSPHERGETVDLSQEEILALLETEEEPVMDALFHHADSVTSRFFGAKIHFRGLLEFSNVCQKDCGYCGIRKSLDTVHRYTMMKREIIDEALWAFDTGYGSIMLQSGELPVEQRLRSMEHVIREIKRLSKEREAEKTGKPVEECRGLGIALSLGELDREWYQRLFDAGAHRYLLRIETSSPELYAELHPADHSWHRRVECLHNLRDIGFQVGTGVMVGLPGQTKRDLAGDVRFFKELRADMVGMGPYVLQEDTPVGQRWMELHPEHKDPEGKKRLQEEAFELTTRMLALTRVVCGNVNIAATTALQAINPGGREIALNRGANLMMPIITPLKYRADYQLYENKPCIDEASTECRGCLTMRINLAGKQIAWNEWGDPPHYFGDEAVVNN